MRFVPAGATANASVETIAINAMAMTTEAAIEMIIRSDMINSFLKLLA
jgi:hypothetical protein